MKQGPSISAGLGLKIIPLQRTRASQRRIKSSYGTSSPTIRFQEKCTQSNTNWDPVGFYSLTPEENEQLPFPTAPPISNDTAPIVQIEVFHQLHCLDSLRKLIYGIHELGDGKAARVHTGLSPQPPKQCPGITTTDLCPDHCIDYLRQVLMYVLPSHRTLPYRVATDQGSRCHGDVTPVVHLPRDEYDPERHPFPYKPNFAVTHKCRNFDRLHNWAAKGNTSGYVISFYPGLPVLY